MKAVHKHTHNLLEEHRRLAFLTEQYARNLKCQSSSDVLNTQARQIHLCESRISKLYILIQKSR